MYLHRLLCSSTHTHTRAAKLFIFERKNNLFVLWFLLICFVVCFCCCYRFTIIIFDFFFSSLLLHRQTIASAIAGNWEPKEIRACRGVCVNIIVAREIPFAWNMQLQPRHTFPNQMKKRLEKNTVRCMKETKKKNSNLFAKKKANPNGNTNFCYAIVWAD